MVPFCPHSMAKLIHSRLPIVWISSHSLMPPLNKLLFNLTSTKIIWKISHNLYTTHKRIHKNIKKTTQTEKRGFGLTFDAAIRHAWQADAQRPERSQQTCPGQCTAYYSSVPGRWTAFWYARWLLSGWGVRDGVRRSGGASRSTFWFISLRKINSIALSLRKTGIH